ncbi:MAG: hypothetical protein EOP84_00440 [Verrucomicrobiaceae bacterium]|nr:MAG: hypothetical protein EOP84_00440 [Verrucomicrobiaceae bacterium]
MRNAKKDAAKSYASAGWAVLPCEPNGKAPLTRRGYLDASTSSDKIDQWWDSTPDANIGLVPPRGFFFLDVDVSKGKQGEQNLRALEDKHGSVPTDVVSLTGGGGRHILLKLPRAHEAPPAIGRLDIDIKGAKGYVIAPPSLHPNGKEYRWDGFSPESFGETLKATREAPDWLWELKGHNGDRPAQRHAKSPLGEYGPSEVEEILRWLPVSWSDNYADWIRVGQALFHQFSGSAVGLELWLAWSSRSDHHDPVDDPDRWLTFGKNSENEITLATLIRAAMEQGYEPTHVGRRSLSEMFQDISDANKLHDGKRGALTFHTVEEIDGLPEPYDFIRHTLFDNQLVVVFGEPGTGKSFFVLDMCARVALGMPWFSKNTEKRLAVYIALEGTGGLRRRLWAWRKKNECDAPPISFATGFFPLGDGEAARRELINHVQKVGAKIVVIDTLARAMPGKNENAPEDMGAAIAGADQIRRSTGATVVLVAHSGKDSSRGVRGHSSLKGAADVEIELSRKGELRWATVTKSKDGVEGGKFHFQLAGVDTGLLDARGEPIWSAAVDQEDATFDKSARLPPQTQAVLRSLRHLCRHEDVLGATTFHAWRSAVLASDWRQDLEDADSRRRTFDRFADRLVEQNVIARDGEAVTFVRG